MCCGSLQNSWIWIPAKWQGPQGVVGALVIGSTDIKDLKDCILAQAQSSTRVHQTLATFAMCDCDVNRGTKIASGFPLAMNTQAQMCGADLSP